MTPIYMLIHSLANKQRREFERLTADKSYSAAQGRILNYLLNNETKEIFQKDIETQFDLRPPSATSLLQSMEKSGLIKRESSSGDARYKKIVCTQKAVLFKDQLTLDHEMLNQKLTQDISEEDLENWRRVTIHIINNLK